MLYVWYMLADITSVTFVVSRILLTQPHLYVLCIVLKIKGKEDVISVCGVLFDTVAVMADIASVRFVVSRILLTHPHLERHTRRQPVIVHNTWESWQ